MFLGIEFRRIGRQAVQANGIWYEQSKGGYENAITKCTNRTLRPIRRELDGER